MRKGVYSKLTNKSYPFLADVEDVFTLQVYNDFMMYKSGVYHHTKLLMSSGFEPFQVNDFFMLARTF